MNRRLVGPVLGILGLVTIGVGGVALMLRVSADAHPEGDLETAVAIIPPSVVALDGLQRITISAPGGILVRTARPADAYAWATGVEASVVRRLESWEAIEVDRIWSTTGILPEYPGDMWRSWEIGSLKKTMKVSAIEPGLAVVIISDSTSPLGEVAFDMTRDRGNGWAWPVLAGGLGALAIALVFLGADLMEGRPEKKEEPLGTRGNRSEPVRKKSATVKPESKKSETAKTKPKKSKVIEPTPLTQTDETPKRKRRTAKGDSA